MSKSKLLNVSVPEYLSTNSVLTANARISVVSLRKDKMASVTVKNKSCRVNASLHLTGIVETPGPEKTRIFTGTVHKLGFTFKLTMLDNFHKTIEIHQLT